MAETLSSVHSTQQIGQDRDIDNVRLGPSDEKPVWHLLQDPDARFRDLGADHFSRHTDPDTKKRGHIRQLEAIGYTVTLTPAA